ncbi:MAG: molybdopterin synthase catalytic subunit, partial [Planctomycetota bacterium]
GGGALFCFEGFVRPSENDKPIVALDYEAYEPMASKMLARIAKETIEKYGLISMCIEHSFGRVEVGECSFRLRIASYHRKEGIAAMDEFIDRMKQDVPLWKTAIYAED